MTSAAHGIARPQWGNLVAAIAAISVFGLALGLMFPLLSLILEQRGVGADLIGYNSAMSPLGIVIAGFLIPAIVRRFGVKPVVLGAAAAAAAIVLAYRAFPDLASWFALRLAQGMCVAVLFSLSESWVVHFAEGRYRGRIVAVYNSVLALTFASGPAIIAQTGIEGWTPFLIGAAVLVAAMVPMALVRVGSDGEMSRPASFSTFAPKAPVLLAAVGVFAIFDAATLGFLPVYAVRKGLDLATAATTLTALIAGNIVLQYPIGWLADQIPRRAVMAACGALTAALALLLPWTMGSWWMWPVLIVMGATGYSVYSMALATLGDRFKGSELAGTSAFATMWGAGALLGALMAGWAIEAFGPDGFAYALAATFVVFLAVMTLREEGR
jgi:MFS family permease